MAQCHKQEYNDVRMDVSKSEAKSHVSMRALRMHRAALNTFTLALELVIGIGLSHLFRLVSPAKVVLISEA